MGVRRAGDADVELVRALRLAAVAEAPEAFATTLERETSRTVQDWRRWFAPGVTLVYLDHSGRGIGLAAGVLDDEPTLASVAAMWVQPDMRGRGVGDALMVALADWARGTGRRLHLHVVADNAAVGHYERHGFHRDGQGRARPDGVREVEMEHHEGT